MEETGYVAVALPSDQEEERRIPAISRNQVVVLHPFIGLFLSPLFGAAALAANSLQLVLRGMHSHLSRLPEHRVAEDPIRVPPSPFAQNALSKEEGKDGPLSGGADANRASTDYSP